ncbi:MAG: hypothetical protein FJZ01_20815 [Candidatus Sericytochromatia bacterium]|nr:hypothetical protein [Candidatus Tanganyikabacteria bacterium]
MNSTRKLRQGLGIALFAATLAGCGIPAATSLVGQGDASLAARGAGAHWGMYNFFALDNDLDNGTGLISSMLRVNAPNVVHASLYDGESQGDSQIFYQNQPNDRLTATAKTEVDSGTAKALEDFLAKATQTSPGKARMLTMADHGGGIIRGICSDWNGPGGKKIIHVNEVNDVLARYPVEILGFDACFMSMVEVAYEVRQNAKFVVGAQTTTRGDFPYASLVQSLDRNLDSRRAAVSVMEAAHANARYTHAFSVLDTAGSAQVAAAMGDLGKVMTAKMGTMKEPMREAIAKAQSYANETSPGLSMYNNYRDLGDVVDRLAALGDPDLARAAKGVRAALARCVVAEKHANGGWGGGDPDLERISGAMIYASTDGTVEQKYLSRSFARDSGWGDVLVKLNSRAGWANPVQKDKYPFGFPSKR